MGESTLWRRGITLLSTVWQLLCLVMALNWLGEQLLTLMIKRSEANE